MIKTNLTFLAIYACIACLNYLGLLAVNDGSLIELDSLSSFLCIIASSSVCIQVIINLIELTKE